MGGRSSSLLLRKNFSGRELYHPKTEGKLISGRGRGKIGERQPEKSGVYLVLGKTYFSLRGKLPPYIGGKKE